MYLKMQILVASTGVIGRQIPIDLIKKGVETMVPMVSDSLEAWHAGSRVHYDHRYHQKRSGSGSRNRRKDGYHRRHEQGLRHDSSEHVHHAGIS